MNRQKKEDVVIELKNNFSESQASFLVNYSGLTVAELQSLRRTLHEKKATFKVAKARLMKIAVADLAEKDENMETFRSMFNDQVGLVFTKDEAPAVAKDLTQFSKKHAKLQVVSAVFESKFLSKDAITAIASLPSREVLLAMVAGTLKEPMAKFARLLQALLEKLEQPQVEPVNEKAAAE